MAQASAKRRSAGITVSITGCASFKRMPRLIPSPFNHATRIDIISIAIGVTSSFYGVESRRMIPTTTHFMGVEDKLRTGSIGEVGF